MTKDKTVTMSRELIERLVAKLYGEAPGNPDDEIDELRALLAAPVAERQPLSVWEGAMPESNGKSNFTVILHTGDLTEGICVYRSEYPDRARYEADCFRNLIGDPAFSEKPFVCDYDADKHSGYAKPDTSPPAPVAVVLPERLTSAELEELEVIEVLLHGQGLSNLSGTMAAARQFIDEVACLDKVKELN